MKFLILPLMVAVPLAVAAAGSADTAFYTTLAQGSMSEVELGNLAQEKSKDSRVKDFAAMMVKDHSAANQKLASLASSKNVSLPKSPSASQAATKDKLESLSGSSFDQAYVESQLKAHQETVSLLHHEISAGRDLAAKAFAESVLPTIEHHLQAVRTLASEEGVKNAQR